MGKVSSLEQFLSKRVSINFNFKIDFSSSTFLRFFPEIIKAHSKSLDVIYKQLSHSHYNTIIIQDKTRD